LTGKFIYKGFKVASLKIYTIKINFVLLVFMIFYQNTSIYFWYAYCYFYTL